MNKYKLTFFFLTPLLYSIDIGPYWQYEVLLVAFVVTVMFMRSRIARESYLDVGLVLLYALHLIVQQFFIDQGNVTFGIQFFIATLIAYIPFWVVRGTHWHIRDLTLGFRTGIHALFWITFLSIVSSYFLGIGERYPSGIAGYRAFGYLGDSFTPVIVFLLLYFVFERRYLFVGLCFGTLLMTGGKAALMLSVVSLAIYVILLSRSTLIRMLAVLTTGLLTLLSINLSNLSWLDAKFEYSLNNRLFSIQIGLEYFRENPIFGIGINQALDRISYDVDRLAASLQTTAYYPVYKISNAYVSALAETGIVGFAFLILLALFWIVRAVRSARIALKLPLSAERSIILAGSLWTIAFLTTYQTTGWFLSGHPQLSWLLMFSTVSYILSQRSYSSLERASTVARHGENNCASPPATNR